MPTRFVTISLVAKRAGMHRCTLVTKRAATGCSRNRPQIRRRSVDFNFKITRDMSVNAILKTLA